MKLVRIALRALALAGAGALLLLGTGCGERGSEEEAAAAPPVGRTLEAIQASGELRVVTRNAPTIYYLDRDEQPAGPDYELVAAFAEHLGVAVTLLVRDTPAAVLDALAAGDADLAAAGLTQTAARAQQFRAGPTYQEISQQVVCHRDRRRLNKVEDLVGAELVVSAGSAYADTLQGLVAQFPALTYREEARGTEQLLAAVAEKEIECTVADSHIAAINRRYHPTLRRQFKLTTDDALVWWVNQSNEADLVPALQAWFAEPATGDRLEAVLERHYAYAELFDFVELRAFQRRLERRYPKYAELFAAAGETYDLAPSLLAAQAYQESHWDPKAKSPTGVRGLMMMTLPTAKAMGVTDRLDPAQSIEGGAKYLARMRDRFREDIPEPDRTYLALAAYNIGRAHMHDAQSLTRERGGDPGRWDDVREVLPLLADQSVYRSLKYGYARGTEPVRYVQRIRNYEDILRASLGSEAEITPSGP
ncbi:MAG: membrane-bound lytic murein transglycosylase MltF [Pseudomonadota bacterium]